MIRIAPWGVSTFFAERMPVTLAGVGKTPGDGY